MKELLENLDLSMKTLYVDLITKYQENSESYNKILDALNHQFLAFELVLSQYKENYLLKYSDIGKIKNLLEKAGYIEKSKSK